MFVLGLLGIALSVDPNAHNNPNQPQSAYPEQPENVQYNKVVKADRLTEWGKCSTFYTVKSYCIFTETHVIFDTEFISNLGLLL